MLLGPCERSAFFAKKEDSKFAVAELKIQQADQANFDWYKANASTWASVQAMVDRHIQNKVCVQQTYTVVKEENNEINDECISDFQWYPYLQVVSRLWMFHIFVLLEHGG